MHAHGFQRSGYTVFPVLIDAAALHGVDAALRDDAISAYGTRNLLALPWCAALAANIRARLIDAGLLTPDYIGVQCTYFEKSRGYNWLVAPHQDLSIPVARRVDHDALAGWSAKDGTLFVQPPVAVLERLVALRLHVDDCGVDDGALKVVPGSHQHGRLQDIDKARLRDAIGEVTCPVAAGGGMAMRPLLVHASSKATGASRRRVLHFVFGPADLPHGLAWAGSGTPGAPN